MKASCTFQVFEFIACEESLGIAVILKQDWEFDVLFPRREQFYKHPHSSRSEHAVGPYYLRFPARCSISLSFLFQALVRDDAQASQAWSARHGNRDLTADRKATFNSMDIHSDIYVRNQVSAGKCF